MDDYLLYEVNRREALVEGLEENMGTGSAGDDAARSREIIRLRQEMANLRSEWKSRNSDASGSRVCGRPIREISFSCNQWDERYCFGEVQTGLVNCRNFGRCRE